MNEEVLAEEIDIEKTKEEYQEIAGENKENGLGIKDESFEALITDPNLILRDVKALCVKHEIDFLGMFCAMGFDKNTFKALLVNKPITEQIYVLNRELNILIFKLGKLSGISTLNARTLLGDVLNSKEWLELLDNTIFPYMAEYDKNGKLDADWFVKNERADETEELVENIREFTSVQTQITQEAENVTKELEGLFEEGKLSISQGEETVSGEYTPEEVEKALEEVNQEGEITLDEEAKEV